MRKQRFRQVHLDFHTSEHIPVVGNEFDAEEFARTLHEAGVDQINLFAKCHHGWMYYDSDKFPRHPGLSFNLLGRQIEACRRYDIITPIYVTAAWDELSAAEHPEWLERTPDGGVHGAGPLQAGWRKLCLNTGYVDHLEQQILDVREKLGPRIDGWWIDIVFQFDCCCQACMKEMRETGLDPKSEYDRTLQSDRVLRRFKERFSKLLRPLNPEAFIFFNAGHVGPYIRQTLGTYTHLELESLPGARDHWGYEHFPISARYARTLGMDFLGMTGKFHKMWGDFGGFKSPPALEYECLRTLAVGAKCCVGDQLHPSGKICKATYELLGSVYREMAKKEEWCEDVQSVTDIGLFTPEPAVGTRHSTLDPSVRGANRVLTENHYQFDIIDAESDFSKYRLIIMPDAIRFNEPLLTKVKSYLAAGGKLLLSYHSGLWEDRDEFALATVGAKMVGPSEFANEYFTVRQGFPAELPDARHILYDRGCVVAPAGGTKVLADLWRPYFNRDYRHFCSHAQTPPDQLTGYPEAILNGQVGYIAHPIFRMIRKHGARTFKRLAIGMIRSLLPDPIVKTSAPSTAELSLLEQPGKKRHVLHLMHYIPESRSQEVDVIEDVIPIYNVQLQVRLAEKPDRVYLAPSLKPIEHTWEDGLVHLTVPEVVGHEMVVFERA